MPRVVVHKAHSNLVYKYVVGPNPRERVHYIDLPKNKVKRIEFYMYCLGNVAGFLASITCADDGKSCDEAPTGSKGWQCAVNGTQLRAPYTIGNQNTKEFPLAEPIKRRAKYIWPFSSERKCPQFTKIVCAYDLRK